MNDVRSLYVLRHAKSSWDDPGQLDHERPLSSRGRQAVTLLSSHFESTGIRPDLVLCSTARRTRETLEAVPSSGEVVIEAGLYEASWGALVERLRGVPAEISSVMVIGHNPAMQMLVLRLAAADKQCGADGEPGHHLSDLQRKFPTGALATLTFRCAWAELRSGCAELAAYVRPKSLLYQ